MSRPAAWIRSIGAGALLGVALAACAPGLNSAPTQAPPIEVTLPSATPATSHPSAPTPPSTSRPDTGVPTPTSAVAVQLLAKGNVFIRRGPDLAFNPMSVLLRGQTAYPTGRDVLARWLQVPLPADPSRSGWISIMSDFTAVAGDVRSLPEIEPAEWPALAFVRNCTYHQMTLEPGGITIPSIIYFPDNDVQVNPGIYTVHDVDVDDYPDVQSIDISEGSAVDIIVDGLGMKKKCPVP